MAIVAKKPTPSAEVLLTEFGPYSQSMNLRSAKIHKDAFNEGAKKAFSALLAEAASIIFHSEQNKATRYSVKVDYSYPEGAKLDLSLMQEGGTRGQVDGLYFTQGDRGPKIAGLEVMPLKNGYVGLYSLEDNEYRPLVELDGTKPVSPEDIQKTIQYLVGKVSPAFG